MIENCHLKLFAIEPIINWFIRCTLTAIWLLAIYTSINLKTNMRIILLVDFRVIKTLDINIRITSVETEIWIFLLDYHIVIKVYFILIVRHIIKSTLVNIKIRYLRRRYFCSVRIIFNILLNKWYINILLWFIQIIIIVTKVKYRYYHFIELRRLKLLFWKNIQRVVKVYFHA